MIKKVLIPTLLVCSLFSCSTLRKIEAIQITNCAGSATYFQGFPEEGGVLVLRKQSGNYSVSITKEIWKDSVLFLKNIHTNFDVNVEINDSDYLGINICSKESQSLEMDYFIIFNYEDTLKANYIGGGFSPVLYRKDFKHLELIVPDLGGSIFNGDVYPNTHIKVTVNADFPIVNSFGYDYYFGDFILTNIESYNSINTLHDSDQSIRRFLMKKRNLRKFSDGFRLKDK